MLDRLDQQMIQFLCILRDYIIAHSTSDQILKCHMNNLSSVTSGMIIIIYMDSYIPVNPAEGVYISRGEIC